MLAAPTFSPLFAFFSSFPLLAPLCASAVTCCAGCCSLSLLTLFLSLYHSTLWLTLLSVVSCWWVPSSDAALRAAEHALLRAHQASSGSTAANLDQQLRQHHAGHIAYTVLQHEEDQPDIGSGNPDENEDATPPPASAATISAPGPATCPAALPTATVQAPFTGTAVVFLHGYGAGKCQSHTVHLLQTAANCSELLSALSHFPLLPLFFFFFSVFCSAFWFLNLPAISRGFCSSSNKENDNVRVYSLDLPGMGSSAHQYTMSQCKNAQQAENYFVSALEGWRQELRLQRMILVGHSFGGLVAASYALRFPSRVSLLLLVSPVGLPVPPPLDPTSPAASPSRAPAWMSRYGLITMAQWLWSHHITLSQVLHWMGPMGPLLFRYIVSRRFQHLDAASAKKKKDGSISPAGLDVQALCKYLYHLNAGPCPGHRGLNLLLRPGAFAVDPLLPRLVAGLNAPTVLVYGADDWMSVSAGQEVALAVAAKRSGPRASDAMFHSEVVIVPQAGHQLALENPRFFNATVVRIVKEHIQRQREAEGAAAATEKDPVVEAAAAVAVDEDAAAATEALRKRGGGSAKASK